MNLLNLTPEEAESVLSQWIVDRGEPNYRTRQVLPRLWQRPVATWHDTTDLPRPLIQALERDFPLQRPTLVSHQKSVDGTVKFLWKLDGDTAIESVLIPERSRTTLCVSSQAGCAYDCVFCATGAMGFQRHLQPWEITAQVRELTLDERYGTPTHVVFMGMGEPLHNWQAVDQALTILNHPSGMGIGARRITVSTIGIVPNLRRLAARPEQFRVAISLHAPSSQRRFKLMPVERKYPIADVLEAVQEIRKRVTFEYVMIKGMNDSDDDARDLAQIARATGALVNLLPLHPGGAGTLRPSSAERIKQFASLLQSNGAKVTVRRSRGLDISGACGQLRIDTPLGSDIEAK
ncbi:MAG: 23S rRNA (adenine(2503)-C(2))-methyltransferase RlmN [Gemmatimonadota bacterium]|nr:MAG: 23S rRNA (adenine(2503)-C(2))-methyltransferase RlmN [Gemmatimonadota bacterium]